MKQGLILAGEPMGLLIAQSEGLPTSAELERFMKEADSTDE